MMLAFVAMTGQAKDVVWDQPTIEYGTTNGDGFFNLALDLTKVELKDNETVVYITAYQRSDYPDFWFRHLSENWRAALYHHVCRRHRTQPAPSDEQGLQARYGLPLPAAAKGYEGIRLHRG